NCKDIIKRQFLKADNARPNPELEANTMKPKPEPIKYLDYMYMSKFINTQQIMNALSKFARNLINSGNDFDIIKFLIKSSLARPTKEVSE
ncbi:6957_t:CDS:1, partial [Racocetra persica]